MVTNKKRNDIIFKIIISILIIIALLPIWGPITFGVILNLGSNISENITVTDSTGDKFRIKIKGKERGTLTQPSWCYKEISVKYKGVNIVSLGSKESEYKGNYYYQAELQSEYHDGNIHAYMFPFAIVYSFDDKKTFTFVCDKDYEYYCETTPAFRKIYDLLH